METLDWRHEPHRRRRGGHDLRRLRVADRTGSFQARRRQRRPGQLRQWAGDGRSRRRRRPLSAARRHRRAPATACWRPTATTPSDGVSSGCGGDSSWRSCWVRPSWPCRWCGPSVSTAGSGWWQPSRRRWCSGPAGGSTVPPWSTSVTARPRWTPWFPWGPSRRGPGRPWSSSPGSKTPTSTTRPEWSSSP